MGGVSVVVMLSAMGALALVILGVAATALAAFIAATVLSIVFACRTKARRERGKKLKGLAALPVALYALSIPVLVWFAAVWVIPFAADVEGDEFADFSQAVTRHDPATLQGCFDAGAFEFPAEGNESLSALLEVAIAYDDALCANAVLAAAETSGAPIDLNAPLPSYAMDGEPYGAEFALVRASGGDGRSAPMIEVLLEAGADPNVESLLDPKGGRPLHRVCAELEPVGLAPGETGRALADSGRAIDLLLLYGADPAALDADGLTAGERCIGRLDSLVGLGRLTRDEADRFVAFHAAGLGLD